MLTSDEIDHFDERKWSYLRSDEPAQSAMQFPAPGKEPLPVAIGITLNLLPDDVETMLGPACMPVENSPYLEIGTEITPEVDERQPEPDYAAKPQEEFVAILCDEPEPVLPIYQTALPHQDEQISQPQQEVVMIPECASNTGLWRKLTQGIRTVLRLQ